MTIKTGLYDECPCGSGRIYKKCCMAKDAGIDGYSPILTNEDDILKYAVFAENWDRANGPVPSFKEYMGEPDLKAGRVRSFKVKVLSWIKTFFGPRTPGGGKAV